MLTNLGATETILTVQEWSGMCSWTKEKQPVNVLSAAVVQYPDQKATEGRKGLF